MTSRNGRGEGERRSNGQRKPSLARITRALNEAAQDAVELHKQRGLPLVVWKDGKTALVPAAEVDVDPGPPKPRRKS